MAVFRVKSKERTKSLRVPQNFVHSFNFTRDRENPFMFSGIEDLGAMLDNSLTPKAEFTIWVYHKIAPKIRSGKRLMGENK